MCRGAGVEQGRRAGQVGQGGHQPVEADRLGRRAGQAAGHAQQPVLRGLDDQPAGGVAQQVAVVDGPQPEVLEPAVGVLVDGEVELAGVVLDEARGLVADQPLGVPERDRLAERGDALAADLLVDVRRQQPRGQPGVLRLHADHLRRRLDREAVQLGGRGAVVQAADGPGGHPQRVDVGEVVGPALDGADDLVHVDGLGVAAALAHLHRRTAGGGRCSVGAACAGGGADLVSVTVMALSSRAGPGSGTGGAGRREGERGAPRRTTLTSRRPSLAASDHRARVCTVRWQVFGLAGTGLGTLSRLDPPSGRRFPDADASSAV